MGRAGFSCFVYSANAWPEVVVFLFPDGRPVQHFTSIHCITSPQISNRSARRQWGNFAAIDLGGSLWESAGLVKTGESVIRFFGFLFGGRFYDRRNTDPDERTKSLEARG